jgi:hypothetical protein
VVVGVGAVGARAARQLFSTRAFAGLLVVDVDHRRRDAVAASLGGTAVAGEWDPTAVQDGDVVVLASPGGHPEVAAAALAHGAHVVSVADAVAEVQGLLGLEGEARRRGRSVVVGAGFAPGLTCLLARHAAAGFDTVDEIHVAKAGTGGPACAQQHHRALTADALDWRDGAWARRRGGSGRELCWFPDPAGAQDCYRAGLADALVLVPAFPGVQRVTARVAASRRDRLTSRFPMLRRPHPEGLLGAARVEVRGRRGLVTDVRVLGAFDRPAVVAGVVAGLAGRWAADGRLARPGAGGLAGLVGEPVPFLRELARQGVRAAAFEGAGSAVSSPPAAP